MSLWWGIGVSLPTCGAFGAHYLIPFNSLVEAFAQRVGLSDADGSLPLGAEGWLDGWLLRIAGTIHGPSMLTLNVGCPSHNIGHFFFLFFLMSVIIKYFYRAQKSQNSAKHLTVMHPWEPLLWGGRYRHTGMEQRGGVHHMPNRMG